MIDALEKFELPPVEDLQKIERLAREVKGLVDEVKDAADEALEETVEDDAALLAQVENMSGGASLVRAYRLIAEGHREEAMRELRALFPHCDLPEPATELRLVDLLEKARQYAA